MNSETSSGEKKAFTFGFSKTKPKTSLIKTDAVKAFEISAKSVESCELITSIEGRVVKSLNKPVEEKKKPLVIPCKKNEIKISKKSAPKEKSIEELVTNPEDLEAIRKLLSDSQKRKENPDPNLFLKIPIDEIEKTETVEEPNYEEIGIEQFGLAALRGMGFKEREGIGLTNKRTAETFVPELRPKGLGLGAGSSSKKHKSESNNTDEQEEKKDGNLKYNVGAYILITNGKNINECGQIQGFDDGLDRIIVKLAKNDQNISLLSSCTKLLSKNEYKKLTERK